MIDRYFWKKFDKFRLSNEERIYHFQLKEIKKNTYTKQQKDFLKKHYKEIQTVCGEIIDFLTDKKEPTGDLFARARTVSAKEFAETMNMKICEYCGKPFDREGKRCPDCVRANYGREVIEEE